MYIFMYYIYRHPNWSITGWCGQTCGGEQEGPTILITNSDSLLSSWRKGNKQLYFVKEETELLAFATLQLL